MDSFLWPSPPSFQLRDHLIAFFDSSDVKASPLFTGRIPYRTTSSARTNVHHLLFRDSLSYHRPISFKSMTLNFGGLGRVQNASESGEK